MKIHDIKNKLDEVKFSTSTGMDVLNSPVAKEISVGYEFEFCVPSSSIEPKPSLGVTFSNMEDDELHEFLLELLEGNRGRIDIYGWHITNSKNAKMYRNRDIRITAPIFDKLFKLKDNIQANKRTATDAYKKYKNKSNTYGDLIRLWIDDPSSIDELFTFDPRKVLDFLCSDAELAELISDYLEAYNDDGNEVDEYRQIANKVVKPAINELVSVPVIVFDSYHEKPKDFSSQAWYIEPDQSIEPLEIDGEPDTGIEIVTSPYMAPVALDLLKRFYKVAEKYKFYTGEEYGTGLHINISIPAKIDILKLAVFLGDEYVLRSFGREENDYAISVIDKLRTQATSSYTGRDIYKTKTKKSKASMKNVLDRPNRSTSLNLKFLKKLMSDISKDHYTSISTHNNKNYVSFRHPGGDYLNEYAKVEQTLLRFIQALVIASDESLYKKEYLTKLVKLIGPPKYDESSSKVREVRQAIKEIITNGLLVYQADIYQTSNYRLSDQMIRDRVRIYISYDAPYIYSRNYATRYIIKKSSDAKQNIVNSGIKIHDTVPLKRFMRVLSFPQVSMDAVKLINSLDSNPINMNPQRHDRVLTEFIRLPYSDPRVKEYVSNLRDLVTDHELANESRIYPEHPTYYFAYGMLTDPKLMGRHKLVGIGELRNFEYKMYYYANVEQSPGNVVYGCLWEINKSDLRQLDHIEGYPNLYDRKTYPVYVDGKKYISEVYVMTNSTKRRVSGTMPTKEYMKKVARGYLSAGIPNEQLTDALAKSSENRRDRHG